MAEHSLNEPRRPTGQPSQRYSIHLPSLRIASFKPRPSTLQTEDNASTRSYWSAVSTQPHQAEPHRDPHDHQIMETIMTTSHEENTHEATPSLKLSVESSKVGLGEKLKSIINRYFRTSKEKSKCVGCYDELRPTKLIIAPCSHQYCHTCIRKMALQTLTSKHQPQAHCCGETIPSKLILSALNSRGRNLKGQYTSRVEEEAVPPAERLYCPNTDCRKWIHTKYLKPGSENQKCPHCRTLVCGNCRDLAHGDRDCVEDPGLSGLLDVARSRHWQRCYNCHAMVEKLGGCHHVRCMCGAHFCYACGRSYPGCRCREGSDPGNNNVFAIGEEDRDPNFALALAAIEQAEREMADEAERTRAALGRIETRTVRIGNGHLR